MSNGTFALIGVLIAIIIRKDKQFGKIESKKIGYTHIGLMIFTIFITGFSLNVLLQMIFKFESTFKVIYVSNWVFSPLMNTILWGIITLLNVVILFSVFNLASRSEKARKLFVMLLPIVCVLSILRSIGDVMSRSTPETPVGLVIILVIAVLSLTYLPIFFFYRNANVKKVIFSNGKTDEKIEKA
jgi:hypothetical protein